ncbi:mannose-1-phosphate guanylyltransferase/mannose-6-phosphate isomerase [Sansalvadorimonas sp. 2012CJ34-2]|uniref:mannose-1-phosphate guanylyltransferase n=1 Tax=Parendozoicomonas callyspongiae TaxID=2942213 RepID=A0ABT0PH98_9GAMM|nr:mannose-1-phosphate guanylyltransferase/mannose-6-phosphate isomerase [Sansalvadorimonas sp. 2012CJ34-2]MCL6269878.1 mannose-1-phosphate guanylyltransferase/mannose-6-phosphate isomerase [Sansalvadorimonas sp. 2012CJ34-2]
MPSDKPIIPVILAGGSGTRLWPLSIKQKPKQFLNLADKELSLFQQTLLRAQNISGSYPPIIVTHHRYRFLVAEQVVQLNVKARILLEPCSRGTAPAITLAAYEALTLADNPWLLVLPSDHYLKSTDSFDTAVSKVIKDNRAESVLVTLGVEPTSAEPGFGYINCAGKAEGGTGLLPVTGFTEKPAKPQAERYLQAGGYYWNSGINLYKAGVFLDEVQHLCPAVYDACRNAYQKLESDLDFLRVPIADYQESPVLSVDKGILEKSSRLMMAKLDAGWSDIGSWKANWEIAHKDNGQNVCLGNIQHVDCLNSLLRSDSRQIAVLGLKNIIVVDTADITLIADKSRSQDVSLFTDFVQGGTDTERVLRPWGSRNVLYSAHGYQVNQLTVKQGQKITLHMHRQRSEHWIILNGSAHVNCETDEYFLEKGNSIVIPAGCSHSLENCGNAQLEVLEMQIGDYLGDDDTIRQ